MGSRVLLNQYRALLTKGRLKCNYFSTTVRLNEKKDLSNLPAAIPIQKPLEDFFKPKEQVDHEKALQGYITIESEQNFIGVVSGVPEEHITTRKVHIYKPPKNAMQSGTDNINYWQIEFDARERWENPLMGWNSSADPLQAVRVQFATLSEAEEHCKRMGWEYLIQEPNRNDPKPRSYGDNFSWNKRTRVSTK